MKTRPILGLLTASLLIAAGLHAAEPAQTKTMLVLDASGSMWGQIGGKTKIDLMDERDVLMLAPGANGVRAYGAIYDADAMIEGVAAQTDIYSKMFTTKDPGELFLMNQSSPLPIPLYPNRTLRARVLV